VVVLVLMVVVVVVLVRSGSIGTASGSRVGYAPPFLPPFSSNPLPLLPPTLLAVLPSNALPLLPPPLPPRRRMGDSPIQPPRQRQRLQSPRVSSLYTLPPPPAPPAFEVDIPILGQARDTRLYRTDWSPSRSSSSDDDGRLQQRAHFSCSTSYQRQPLQASSPLVGLSSLHEPWY
jgi:hypothetical protein